MILLSILLFGTYTVLILSFVVGFDKVPVFHRNLTMPEKSNFSIVIPYRNEVENLPILLDSIKQLKYNKEKFEILLVDDSSEDASVELLKKFQIDNPNIKLSLLKNIRNSNSPKKDAIQTAITKAKFEWIITTDADCLIPENWLKTFDSYIQNLNPKMLIAPVSYFQSNTFLSQFQILDFLSLQGSTIGGFGIKKPFLCNGANLCYAKSAFETVHAFQGNDSIASGDDIFILEKMLQRYPKEVFYLKSEECIVKTNPLKTVKALLQQRIRWASKTSAYQDNFGKIMGLVVFTTNLYLLFLLVMAFMQYVNWMHIGLAFIVKFNVDFLLLYKTASFFKQETVLKNYFLSSLIHPFFIAFTAILSFGKGYQWKGRNFTK